MNNFYFIDKPLKYSSFDVIRVLKKKLNIKKIGHTGTLDPLATGGLLIACGNYTKLIPYLEKAKKTYEFEISLDGTTASFDLAEEVNFLEKSLIEKYKKELSLEKIQEILNKNFLGKIFQVPPKYSALKINGERAYKMVREGKNIEMKKREVEIFSIKILSYNYPKLFLEAEVSAGTYVRSIANELGQILKTGGYITKLRRTKIDNLDISLACSLDDFSKEKILDEKKIFPEKNFISLQKDILEKINNGLKIYKKFSFTINENLFIYNGIKITNVVSYDGEKLIAKRKII